jgi:hypothetical protein
MLKALGVAIIAAACVGLAPAHAAQNNGYGPDPDGDGNPATRTWAMARIGADDSKLDPRFRIINFEPPPGAHGDRIADQYRPSFGVGFSKGLKRQICNDQRYFQYDTLCTYLAPPSGSYAAYYRSDVKNPLVVSYDRPVCAAALSVFPIGGKEGEKFEVLLQPYNAAGDKLEAAKVSFAWTMNTFRWRAMVGGFFLKEPAPRVEVSVRSLDPEQKTDVIHFLMDDVASIEKDCAGVLAEIRKAAGYETAAGALVTESAKE